MARLTQKILQGRRTSHPVEPCDSRVGAWTQAARKATFGSLATDNYNSPARKREPCANFQEDVRVGELRRRPDD
jgi:hypothetical protein